MRADESGDELRRNCSSAATPVSRSGELDRIDHPNFEAVTGDATDPDVVAKLAIVHDAVASALGPGEDVDVLTNLVTGLIEGLW